MKALLGSASGEREEDRARTSILDRKRNLSTCNLVDEAAANEYCVTESSEHLYQTPEPLRVGQRRSWRYGDDTDLTPRDERGSMQDVMEEVDGLVRDISLQYPSNLRRKLGSEDACNGASSLSASSESCKDDAQPFNVPQRSTFGLQHAVGRKAECSKIEAREQSPERSNSGVRNTSEGISQPRKRSFTWPKRWSFTASRPRAASALLGESAQNEVKPETVRHDSLLGFMEPFRSFANARKRQPIIVRTTKVDAERPSIAFELQAEDWEPGVLAALAECIAAKLQNMPIVMGTAQETDTVQFQSGERLGSQGQQVLTLAASSESDLRGRAQRVVAVIDQKDARVDEDIEAPVSPLSRVATVIVAGDYGARELASNGSTKAGSDLAQGLGLDVESSQASLDEVSTMRQQLEHENENRIEGLSGSMEDCSAAIAPDETSKDDLSELYLFFKT